LKRQVSIQDSTITNILYTNNVHYFNHLVILRQARETLRHTTCLLLSSNEEIAEIKSFYIQDKPYQTINSAYFCVMVMYIAKFEPISLYTL